MLQSSCAAPPPLPQLPRTFGTHLACVGQTEVSLQPWRAFRPDGVILFSDILTPLTGMGIDFQIGEGIHVDDPIRTLEVSQDVGLASPPSLTKLASRPLPPPRTLTCSYACSKSRCRDVLASQKTMQHPAAGANSLLLGSSGASKETSWDCYLYTAELLNRTVASATPCR